MYEKNVLCVDLEEWYDANLAVGINKKEAEKRVEGNVCELLKLFKKTNTKCTFFVLGSVAEAYPELIKRIKAEGHEIACHGYAHQLVYSQTPEEFRDDIRKAKNIIEGIIDDKVISYRAPSWSICDKSFWALKILQEEGFQNDSSIFPFKTFLYGVSGAPTDIYSTKKYDEKTSLTEYPPSTIKIFGVNVPYAGGFYFRTLPIWFISMCIKHNNSIGKCSIMYIHPWEIDTETPRIKLNLRDSFIQYNGIKGCKRKLSKILSRFEFVAMKEI